MQLIKRRPGVGYYDSWLWIPKTHSTVSQISATFTFAGRTVVQAWAEEPHHYRVPRNYLKPETLSRLPFPLHDARIQNFPRVKFNSSVVLDSREPEFRYQRDGSAALLAANDGILCLRCGAGKTVVALHSAAQLDAPILITVTDDGLLEQWLEEIDEWLGIPPEDVGVIGGKRSKRNKEMDWERPIVVAHVQTLARRALEERLPVEMTQHFGVIIPDEAHVMGAPHFNAALPPFHGRRWGLTATPEREDEFDALLRFTLGDVVYSYLRPSLTPSIYFRQLPTTLNFKDPVVKENTHDVTGEFHHGKTYGFLARSNKDGRTDRIVADVRDALSTGRQVLVLAHSKEMTQLLGEHFPDAGIVNGDVHGPERRRRIRECNPVIAVMQLGKQALNKPALDTLFVVEPVGKAGVLQQTMGRILRKLMGKSKEPVVVFYQDVNIAQMSGLCGKIQRLLTRWPANKGGRIKYKIIKIGEKAA